MVRLLLIGATGWVGSAAAHKIAIAHPEYEYVALVRTKDKAEMARAFLPDRTRVVISDFSNFGLIADEAAASDIILNWASSDAEGLNNAILEGLQRKKDCASYLIHTSGTGLLTYEDIKNGRESNVGHKIYNDWEGVNEVVALPDDAPHMNVDRAILRTASKNPSIRTAIVCPPLIYGISKNENGAREHSAARQYVVDILHRGRGFFLNEGQSRWSTVHIDDLAQLFLILVEQAAQGGGKASWGSEAYYFAEDGEIRFKDFATDVSRIAFEKGYLSTQEVDSITTEEGHRIYPFTTMMTLHNSRSMAIRARKLLGWEPVNVSIVEDLAQNWRFSADEGCSF